MRRRKRCISEKLIEDKSINDVSHDLSSHRPEKIYPTIHRDTRTHTRTHARTKSTIPPNPTAREIMPNPGPDLQKSWLGSSFP